jgi:hypothetical protein
MKRFGEADDPRRRMLIQALAAGTFATGLPGVNALAASLFGDRPAKLPPGQSIYRISGEALVNDKPATLDTRIKPGDTVQTAKDSELVFVVSTNAMILRGGTTVVIEAEEKSPTIFTLTGLRMLAGKLLSVSRNTPMRVRTVSATVGIRGTGFYIESDPEQTYFCTCYGATDVQSNSDPESKALIAATHHDRPVYILKDAAAGRAIRDAPFINHTDQELALIETLVGRTPPFVFAKDSYSGPRRNY